MSSKMNAKPSHSLLKRERKIESIINIDPAPFSIRVDMSLLFHVIALVLRVLHEHGAMLLKRRFLFGDEAARSSTSRGKFLPVGAEIA